MHEHKICKNNKGNIAIDCCLCSEPKPIHIAHCKFSINKVEKREVSKCCGAVLEYHHKDGIFDGKVDGLFCSKCGRLCEPVIEKCGVMIMTPTPLHNGGMWCAEQKPCPRHSPTPDNKEHCLNCDDNDKGEPQLPCEYCQCHFPQKNTNGWENEGLKKPDIMKVKCSCGQYYAMLDHCCYEWVEEFSRECGFMFSGSLGQLHKEKVKSFIKSLLTKQKEKIIMEYDHISKNEKSMERPKVSGENVKSS